MSSVSKPRRTQILIGTAIALGVATTAGVFSVRVPGQDKPANQTSRKVLRDDPKWRALAKSRVQACQLAVDWSLARIENNLGNHAGEFEEIAVWSRRLMENKIQAAGARAERIAAIREHRDRMRQIERRADDSTKAGQCQIGEMYKAKDFCLEADQKLIEEGVDPGLDDPAVQPKARDASPAPPAPPAPR